MQIETFLRENPGAKIIYNDFAIHYNKAIKKWIVESISHSRVWETDTGFDIAFARWLELTGAKLPVY